ncbi:MAG: DUF2062 domain-containing protein [Thermoanaerobaculales bacterium]|nr:DUF2062 domain-containing protein [Thermoanaerobaculales bacterium]
MVAEADSSPSPPQTSRRRRLADWAYRLATEGQSPGAQATAIGLGVFIGATPFYGLHIIMVLLVARLAGLSRVKMLAASMISNPLFAPFLVWAELQVGNRLLRGRWFPMVPADLEVTSLWHLSADLLVGALVVGGALGMVSGLVIWWWIPRGVEANERRRKVELAAERFLDVGLLEWWRSRRELCGNPQLAQRVSEGEFAPGGRFLDLGCGNGALLSLALEVEENRASRDFTGVTLNAEAARNGRVALGPKVSIEVGDPAVWPLPPADTIVVWYSKRRNAPNVDERLVKRMYEALGPGGVAVVAGSGGRFPIAKSEGLDDLENLFEAVGFVVERAPRLPHDLHRSRLVVARKDG